MPALVLFDTRMSFAGDDLLNRSILFFFVRFLQMIAIVVISSWVHAERNGADAMDTSIDDPACSIRVSWASFWAYHYADALVPFLSFAFIVATMGSIMEYMTFRVACRGTPTTPEARGLLIPLLQFRILPLTMLRLIFVVLGCLFLSNAEGYYVCRGREETVRKETWFLWLMTLVLSQVVETAMFLWAWLPMFLKHAAEGLCGKRRRGRGGMGDQSYWEKVLHYGVRCCSYCWCSMLGGGTIKTDDLSQIAETLEYFFNTDNKVDVVSSDITVGFLMLLRTQRQAKYEVLQWINETATRDSNSVAPSEIMITPVARHSSGLINNPRSSGPYTSMGEEWMNDSLGSIGSATEWIPRSGHESLTRFNSRRSSIGSIDENFVLNTSFDDAWDEWDNDPLKSKVQNTPRRRSVSFEDEEKSPPDDSPPVKTSDNTRRPVPRRSSVSFKDVENMLSDDNSLGSGVKLEKNAPSNDLNQSTITRKDLANSKVTKRMLMGAAHAKSVKNILKHMADNATHELIFNDNDFNPRASITENKYFNFVRERADSVTSVNHRYRAVIRNALTETNSFDKFVVAEGARFMRFSMAIYTWMVYCAAKPCTGFCQLVCRSCCGLRQVCSQQKRKFQGEVCCGWHKIALLQQSKLDESEIAYAQFEQGVKETPYCIAIDHDWKTIVVAIRGTLSLDDAIASLKVMPENLEELGKLHGFDGKNEYAHAGMLACTLWIYEDLKRHGTLDKLLLGDSPLYPNYRLRVIGHSLGAGCATLLSLMLRRTFPTLRCLAFSPPGCVVTERTAIECKKFTVSYVLNSDIIPRLSLDSMENLRDEVLELIARIKVPKYMVYRTYIKEMYEKDIAESNDNILYPIDDMPETPYYEAVENFRTSCRLRNATLSFVKLYPPGHIVHLAKIKNKKSLYNRFISLITCGLVTRGQYETRWVENDDFREIVISKTMIIDHLPFMICTELEDYAKRYGMEPPFLPDGIEESEMGELGGG